MRIDDTSILVTGGCGLIGSTTIDLLLKDYSAARGADGHGPSWSLTREIAGKTVTTVIPVAAVEQTRQQITEYKRFRILARDLVETSEQLCDAQLRPAEATSEVAQEGGLQAAFKAEVLAEIDALVGGGGDDWDLEAIELAARREALRVAARAVEQRLNADTSDHSGPTAPCPSCSQPARDVARHAKTFTSVLGPLRLTRAYPRHAVCGGLLSARPRAGPGTHVAVSGGHAHGRAGGRDGLFEEGHALLHTLAGVDVPTTHVERVAEALGREIAEDEHHVVEPPGPTSPWRRRCTWGLMGRGCRCARRSWWIVRASSPTARPRRARSARHGVER